MLAVGYAYMPDGLNFHTLIEHWNGRQWSIVPSPNVPPKAGRSDQLNGVAVGGPTTLWAAGTSVHLALGAGLRSLVLQTTQG